MSWLIQIYLYFKSQENVRILYVINTEVIHFHFFRADNSYVDDAAPVHNLTEFGEVGSNNSHSSTI